MRSTALLADASECESERVCVEGLKSTNTKERAREARRREEEGGGNSVYCHSAVKISDGFGGCNVWTRQYAGVEQEFDGAQNAPEW